MSTGHRARRIIFRFIVALGLWLYTFSSTAHARPAIYIVYLTEPNAKHSPSFENDKVQCLAENLFGLPKPKTRCNLATSLWNKKEKAKTGVDEAGNRFNCKNKFWYDLTCKGEPTTAKGPTNEEQATVLVDVSQSMRYYDNPTGGTCKRAALIHEIRRQDLPVKLYWHAEQMSGEVDFHAMGDGTINQSACKTIGDNRIKDILSRALRIHGKSRKPVFLITDASEQSHKFSTHLKKYQAWRGVASGSGWGYKEIFIPNWQLRTKIIDLIKNPR